MFDKSQLMRGTIEGCTLKIISNETTYGYDILVYLNSNGFSVTEGTLYPLLLRLEKNGYISAFMMDSPLGPKRKYYTKTKSVKEHLKSFEECWYTISSAVNKILASDSDE